MAEMTGRQWRLKSKVWLELAGHPLIGEGRMAMLQAIDRHGSIIQASREIGIPYRRVRGAIRDMEGTLGRCLVRAYRGGGERGGARLTPDAHALMDVYRKVSQGLHGEVDARFQDVFG
jgi:molybdate transport system regulatory protein